MEVMETIRHRIGTGAVVHNKTPCLMREYVKLFVERASVGR